MHILYIEFSEDGGATWALHQAYTSRSQLSADRDVAMLQDRYGLARQRIGRDVLPEDFPARNDWRGTSWLHTD